ncbi:hypothetical protein L8956_17720 [Peribacillus frigoritolerans]|uniref:hypothetical protein n=1 Tax=Peribacillus frigoritolerans TaxID=450367 RepID=UPI001EFC3F62|nr:hypothetical protein [Peribacillus frigoritolerans]ULM95671.1 hypothetical protein L8956_17720 [Peribacillus frigoritolerans]
MAFDILKCETDKVVTYRDIEYRVINNTDSGLLIVAKEEEVKKEAYPLQIFTIPDEQ